MVLTSLFTFPITVNLQEQAVNIENKKSTQKIIVNTTTCINRRLDVNMSTYDYNHNKWHENFHSVFDLTLL